MATTLPILWSFLKIGAVGYGGGPSMIPLFQAEVVERHAWMTETQFLDALAAGNALPGPIATKMAIYIGYQVGGAAGAVAGLVGVLLPSTVLILTLSAVLVKYAEHPRVAGALHAVRPVVVGMLAYVVIDMAPASMDGWLAVGLCLAALGLLFLKVHPAWLLIGAAALGAVTLAR